MLAALMVLQRECTNQRYALSLSDPDDPCTTDERRDVEQQCCRAADIIEALSNPPETVEELRERIVELTGDSTDVASEAGNVLRTITDRAMLTVGADSRKERIRAAWFAIVGLEVGRGN